MKGSFQGSESLCLDVCSQVSCPYSEMNLNKEGLLPDRLSGERPLTLSGPHPRGRRPDPHTITTTQTSSTPEHPEGAEDSQNRFAAEHEQGWHLTKTAWTHKQPLTLPGGLLSMFCMQLYPVVSTWERVICVARKPATVEAERLGRNNQPEPPSGASEQSHNGTRPKR